MLTGRFAPSPTGPLHMGSLVTAVASFLDIKARGGRWYVRIDNLDPPREDPHAIRQILDSLTAHALEGDQPVDYQSTHTQRYEQALELLEPHIFYCTCSRRDLADHDVYPGTCRNRVKPRPDAAIRIRTRDTEISFDDGMAGIQRHNLARETGDFIIRRRDGLWAYNLATAVDDGHDTTHVLRGQDLLPITAQQIYLMQLLALDVPAYTHIPLLHFPDGSKLSKQTHAPALDDECAPDNLRAALAYLGMATPVGVELSSAAWLDWSLERWPAHVLPGAFLTYTFN